MARVVVWVAAVAALFGISTARASTFTFTSSVQVSGLTTTIPGPPAGYCTTTPCSTPITASETRWISATPFDFRDQPYSLVGHFTNVSITLTIFDGDTNTNDYDHNHIYFYFNSIHARWWANYFTDDKATTRTLVNPLTDFLDTWPLIEESFRELGTIYVGLLDDTPDTPNELSFDAGAHPIATLTITAEIIDVPEPNTMMLMIASLGALGAWRRRRSKSKV